MTGLKVIQKQTELVNQIEVLKENIDMQTLKKALMQELKENNYEETEEILRNSKDELSRCISVHSDDEKII